MCYEKLHIFRSICCLLLYCNISENVATNIVRRILTIVTNYHLSSRTRTPTPLPTQTLYALFVSRKEKNYLIINYINNYDLNVKL